MTTRTTETGSTWHVHVNCEGSVYKDHGNEFFTTMPDGQSIVKMARGMLHLIRGYFKELQL